MACLGAIRRTPSARDETIPASPLLSAPPAPPQAVAVICRTRISCPPTLRTCDPGPERAKSCCREARDSRLTSRLCVRCRDRGIARAHVPNRTDRGTCSAGEAPAVSQQAFPRGKTPKRLPRRKTSRPRQRSERMRRIERDRLLIDDFDFQLDERAAFLGLRAEVKFRSDSAPAVFSGTEPRLPNGAQPRQNRIERPLEHEDEIDVLRISI